MVFNITVALLLPTLAVGQPANLRSATVSIVAPLIANPKISEKSILLEAASAVMTGNTLSRESTGFRGQGYAGDFVPDGARIVWQFPGATPGLYTARIRFSTPFGKKGFDLVVNGKKTSSMLPETGKSFSTIDAGRVELVPGTNSIAIERGWGYFRINSIELVPSPPAKPLQAPTAMLSDSRATRKTRDLYSDLRRNYGKTTLSGQIGFSDTDYLARSIKRTPAIQGSDFIEYSPTRVAHGANPKGEVEKMIAASRSGQIVTMLWHWNAPAGILDAPYTDKNGKKVDAHWWRGFYTDSTTFDLAKAIDNPKSRDYGLLVHDIDVIALQMKKFSDADVPVLWRPLHEAEGGWFWWGAKGPEPFKKLWRLMYSRMTNYHKLHNLIWVYSSGTDPKWYPGDGVVDIIGIDQYPSDPSDALAPVSDTLRKQYDGRKMLALTEFGGVPDVQKMRRFGVQWSYFVSWQGDLGPHKHSVPELRRLYNAPTVVTLKELPSVRK